MPNKESEMFCQPQRTCQTGPRFWTVCIGLCFCLGACGGKKPDVQSTGSQTTSQTVAQPSVCKTEEEKPPESGYVYSPVGKRDPFRSEYKIINKPSKEGPGGILTKYEIEQMKLTTIISGIPNPVAQVELPDGKGVTVKVGSAIGKNKGRVVAIKSKEVVIAEEYQDFARQKKVNYIKMELYKEKDKENEK